MGYELPVRQSGTSGRVPLIRVPRTSLVGSSVGRRAVGERERRTCPFFSPGNSPIRNQKQGEERFQGPSSPLPSPFARSLCLFFSFCWFGAARVKERACLKPRITEPMSTKELHVLRLKTKKIHNSRFQRHPMSLMMDPGMTCHDTWQLTTGFTGHEKGLNKTKTPSSIQGDEVWMLR